MALNIFRIKIHCLLLKKFNSLLQILTVLIEILLVKTKFIFMLAQEQALNPTFIYFYLLYQKY